ncbi:MAG TPA: hypothetical protein VJN18_01635 [Polyangiaceae bacterium]|nr:hypothetical protein [Polyangiaceae bacterium]
MSIARKFRSSSPPSLDWIAGMVQEDDLESDQVTLVWIQGDEVLAERTVVSSDATAALIGTFTEALVKRQAVRPTRIRVQGEGMAEVLRSMIPPSISVVRAPTPELITVFERRAGLPAGSYTGQLPTGTARFLEVPPLGRVASEIYAQLSRRLHPSRTVARFECAAVGLEDAGVVERAPSGELPSLTVYRDYGAMLEALRRAPHSEAWDAELVRDRISYVRRPSMTEHERQALSDIGWYFDPCELQLQPVAEVLDGRKAVRAPNEVEREALTVAAFAMVAMLAEYPGNISLVEDQAQYTMLFKLGGDRVANVQISRELGLTSPDDEGAIGGAIP